VLKRKHYIAFTSHFIISNPGSGAWTSAVYEVGDLNDKNRKRYNNYLKETTSNYLDLEAIVKTIETIAPKSKLSIIHDSSYVDKIITRWIFKWEANNFITNQSNPLSNLEMIKRLSILRKSHNVEFIYTGSKDKPIYNQMAQQFSKLYLHSRLKKDTPEDIYNNFTKGN
jgi:ribonuclease HI